MKTHERDKYGYCVEADRCGHRRAGIGALTDSTSDAVHCATGIVETDLTGPYLPVGLTPCCVATFPEADVGRFCSILAPQMTAVRTKRPLAAVSLLAAT